MAQNHNPQTPHDQYAEGGGRGGRGGRGGGKGGKGKGGKGKGGKGKGGRSKNKSTFKKQWQQVASASARNAFKPQELELQQEAGRAAAHQGAIDSAYGEYQGYLTSAQKAQQLATERARRSSAQTNALLEGVGYNEDTTQALGLAGEEAKLGGPAGAGAQQLLALGQGASAARKAGYDTADSAMADIGLAALSDLGRRGVTSQRDRIAAMEDTERYAQGVAEDQKQLAKAKGDYKAEMLNELLQWGKTHRLGKFQAKTERQAAKADSALAWATLQETARSNKANEALERFGIKSDNRNARKDRKADKKGGKKGGGSSGDSYEGLSPGDKKDRKKLNNQVKSVQDVYERARRNGASREEARRRALRKTGGQRWMAAVVKDLVEKGKLTAHSRKLVKAKYPDGQIPKWLRGYGK